MTIIQTGMTTVMLQAIVQPMVPSSSRMTFTTKSMTFLEALCVSLILPNRESYEGGSATKIFAILVSVEVEYLPLGSTASSYDGGGPRETPWCAGTVPGMS